MSTARVFDELWWRYDSWYERNPVTADNEARLAAAALGDPGGPCLEVGVGTGYFASRLGCAFGVDPSLGMLRVARARGVEVALARGEALPIATGSLAAVLMVVTICFLDDPQAAIGEAARALRAGGALVACIVPRDSPWGAHYETLARRGHPFYSHARFYTVREVEELAAAAGLEPEAALGTLSYPPGAPPRPEPPAPYRPGHGFACIRARKPQPRAGGGDEARKGGAAPPERGRAEEPAQG